MTPPEPINDPAFGTLLHAIGGLASASFYLPYKRVRGWRWEHLWLTGGLFSWLIAPFVFASVLTPGWWDVLKQVPTSSLLWTYLFGAMWGIGGLNFGLTMRYLGVALGTGIALGLCAFFGTLVPPIFLGKFGKMLKEGSGVVVLVGLGVCLAGIAVGAYAGLTKEKEGGAKHAANREFHFGRGIVVALIAGFMSACMSFAFEAGKPIGDAAVAAGIPALWQNLPILIVAFLGGLTSNAIYCFWRLRKMTEPDAAVPSTGHGDSASVDAGATRTNPPLVNLLWCAFGGVLWYLQFFFYGMGHTRMGDLGYASWSLHMSSIIFFGSCWGLVLGEWRGASRKALAWLIGGGLILLLSMAVIGLGNRLAGGGGH